MSVGALLLAVQGTKKLTELATDPSATDRLPQDMAAGALTAVGAAGLGQAQPDFSALKLPVRPTPQG